MRCKPAWWCSNARLEAEHNEVSTLKPLLTEVLCKGRMLTSDAAQSYHDFGRLVHRAGGDVVLFIKDNTRATRADLELFFEDPEADRRTWQSFEQIETGHGRLERRQITTSPDRNRVFAPGLGRGRTGLSCATRTPKRCGPQRLSQVIRAHWAVENRLHWRRDATLGEDRCGVRLPPVAQMLAVLNSVVLSLMDLHQVANVARQRRRFASHPHEALAWVLDF
jgi:hypothetical protein